MPNHDYRPDLMGSAEIVSEKTVVAGDWTSVKLIYTAGKFGIDDLGGLKVAMRTHSDMTPLQSTDPTAPGYLTVETSNGAPVEFDFAYKRNIRPWGNAITVQCKQFLKPGDQVIFNIGDTTQGSPGVRMQTHCESKHQFRVTVDAFATVDYTPIEENKQPYITIVPGEASVWKAQLPTLRKVNDKFRLIVRAEDRWGNPTDKFEGQIQLKANGTINDLPDTLTFEKGDFSAELENLTISEEGDYKVEVFDGDTLLATSNPLRVRSASPFNHYWSDMHGQSGETIGSGTAREYFQFAKHKSFLDIAGHQGNDFQISDAFWDQLNSLSAEFNEEGKFLCLPGYEWSGNTGLGGDHNIWYRNEGRPIYRSSRAIVQDKTRPETDCHDVKELFEALKGEDVLVVPHVGGRFADVTYAHDATVEPSIEVHSSWGTFDWIVQDSLKLGYRIGIVASSDGHKGRPGSSYPGDAKFGSYGGLTCHLLPELTRDELCEQFRRRHHYATTGTRLYLSAEMHFNDDAKVYHRNPEFEDSSHDLQQNAIMGDIVQTEEKEATFKLELVTPSPILKVELYDGLTMLEKFRPYGEDDLGSRLRVTCKGQENRGRGRLVKWTADAKLEGAKANRIVARNYYNPDNQPKLVDPNHVSWKTVTTGGFSSFDIWLDNEEDGAHINIETNQGNLSKALDEIRMDNTMVECGGMDKKLAIQRLPEKLDTTTLELERTIQVPTQGDAAIYARITMEDGHVAWSSPIYVYRNAADNTAARRKCKENG